MTGELRHYLNSIKSELRLDPSAEREVICELYTHLEERTQELKESGLSEEEAIKAAVDHFGATKMIAGGINEVHSSGSWEEATIAALPHLLFALLFTFCQWYNISWLLATLGFLCGVAAYGWRHHKPVWLFSWLGYLLIFLLAGVILSLFVLGRSLFLKSGLEIPWWVWVAISSYIPFALWLLVSVTLQAVRRDWLLGSLMALPLPILTGWFLEMRHEGTLLEYGEQRLYGVEPWIALSFLSLAAMVILFVRSGHRSLKGGSLVAAGIITLTLVACSSRNLFNLGVLTVVILLILGGPAFLERKVGHREVEDWDWLRQSFLKQG
jgi:hypothetical protein